MDGNRSAQIPVGGSVDLGPDVRPTDPPTSHAAAESLPLAVRAQQCRKVLDAITHAARYSNRVGATADEIAAHLAYAGQPVPQRSVIARRCTDLRDRGLIKDSGSTRPGTSGRQAICWILTDRGRAS